MIEHKVLALEAKINPDTGEGEGLAAVFGNVDDGGDVILKGFFEPVLDAFLTEGFFSWGHNWDDPIAMPTKAEETDVGLVTGWVYHSTPRAQECRTITTERLDNGKTMGLSIGYEPEPDGVQYREDGVRLLIRAKRLFEVGHVLVPMNRLATVTDAKGVDNPIAGNSGDPDRRGRTYQDHSARVVADLESWRDRTVDLYRKAIGEKEGRAISSARRERLEGHLVGLRDVIRDLEALLTETAPADDGKQLWAMRARARLALARAEHDITAN